MSHWFSNVGYISLNIMDWSNCINYERWIGGDLYLYNFIFLPKRIRIMKKLSFLFLFYFFTLAAVYFEYLGKTGFWKNDKSNVDQTPKLCSFNLKFKVKPKRTPYCWEPLNTFMVVFLLHIQYWNKTFVSENKIFKM